VPARAHDAVAAPACLLRAGPCRLPPHADIRLLVPGRLAQVQVLSDHIGTVRDLNENNYVNNPAQNNCVLISAIFFNRPFSIKILPTYL
jgi:hypothetical protein